MKKFIDWGENWLPYIWSVLWMVAITFISCGVAAWSIRWFLKSVGVMV